MRDVNKILMAAWLMLLSALSMASVTNIAVPKDVLDNYRLFLDGRDPLSIQSYSGATSRRDVVEIVLLQQALHLGGFKGEIKFVVADAYARILTDIIDGKTAISGTTLWFSDIEPHKQALFISAPAIQNGEFEAGLYTVEHHHQALAARSAEDLQQLSAVSNKMWVADWKTLSQLKLKKLFHTVKWSSMVKMVNGNRADFLLAPFQNTADLSFVADSIKFIPIPNLKIGLQGSRHFISSKAHPNGEKIALALDKGMDLLISQNIVNKAYRQSGFFNEAVKNWKKIGFD